MIDDCVGVTRVFAGGKPGQKRKYAREGVWRAALVLLASMMWASIARGADGEEYSADSFTRCVRDALRYFGTTVTPAEVRVRMLLPFGPAILTNQECMWDGCVAVEPYLLGLLADAYGVEAEYLALKPGAWKQSVARRYLRERMAETLRDGGVVMVEGEWDVGGPIRMWGFAREVRSEVITGEIERIPAVLPLGPRAVLLLNVTNSSLAPRMVERTTLRDGIMHAHGTHPRAPLASLLRGKDAVEYVGFLGMRTPWCRGCGARSRGCVARVVKRWAQDAALATGMLIKVRAEVPASRGRLVEEAFSRYTGVHTQLVELAAEIAHLPHNDAGDAQYGLGVRLAALGAAWAEAATRVGEALGLPTPALILERGDLPPTLSAERAILRALPLFRDLEGGDDDFMCALYIVNYVVGTRDPITWLKGLSGEPFAIPPAPARQERAVARGIFLLVGFVPEFYVCPSNAPRKAQERLRKEIIAAVQRGVPVMARGLDQPEHWGVIVAYKDFGRVLVARTPSDVGRAFFETRELPTEVYIPAAEATRWSDQRMLQRVLRHALTQYGATTGVYGGRGISGLREWRARVQEFALTGDTPPIEFARENGERWREWVTRRRDAYRFLQLGLRRVPQAGPDLLVAINLLVGQVNTLNAALADKIVLHEVGGVAVPPTWSTTCAAEQANVMATLINNEVRIVGALSNVVTRLETRGNRAAGPTYIDEQQNLQF